MKRLDEVRSCIEFCNWGQAAQRCIRGDRLTLDINEALCLDEELARFSMALWPVPYRAGDERVYAVLDMVEAGVSSDTEAA